MVSVVAGAGSVEGEVLMVVSPVVHLASEESVADSDQAAVTEVAILAVAADWEVSEASMVAEAAAAFKALADQQEAEDIPETAVSEVVAPDLALTDKALEAMSMHQALAYMALEAAHTAVDCAEAHGAWARLVDLHLIWPAG